MRLYSTLTARAVVAPTNDMTRVMAMTGALA